MLIHSCCFTFTFRGDVRSVLLFGITTFVSNTYLIRVDFVSFKFRAIWATATINNYFSIDKNTFWLQVCGIVQRLSSLKRLLFRVLLDFGNSCGIVFSSFSKHSKSLSQLLQQSVHTLVKNFCLSFRRVCIGKTYLSQAMFVAPGKVPIRGCVQKTNFFKF